MANDGGIGRNKNIVRYLKLNYRKYDFRDKFTPIIYFNWLTLNYIWSHIIFEKSEQEFS